MENTPRSAALIRTSDDESETIDHVTNTNQGTCDKNTPEPPPRQAKRSPTPSRKPRLGNHLWRMGYAVLGSGAVIAAIVTACLSRCGFTSASTCTPNDAQPCAHSMGSGFHKCDRSGREWSECLPQSKPSAHDHLPTADGPGTIRLVHEGVLPETVSEGTISVLKVLHFQYLDTYTQSISNSEPVRVPFDELVTVDFVTIRVTLDPTTRKVRHDVLNLGQFQARIARLGHRYDAVSIAIGAPTFTTLPNGRIMQQYRQRFRGIFRSVTIYEDCGTKTIVWYQQNAMWRVERDYQVQVAQCGLDPDDPA